MKFLAHICARLWGLGHAGPHRHKVAGPRGKAALWAHFLPPWADSFRCSRAEIRLAAARGCLGCPGCSGVDMTTAMPGVPCPCDTLDLSGSYRFAPRQCAMTLHDFQVVHSGETRQRQTARSANDPDPSELVIVPVHAASWPRSRRVASWSWTSQLAAWAPEPLGLFPCCVGAKALGERG
jgi:hypothetical protein